jgi:hypothetical protein
MNHAVETSEEMLFCLSLKESVERTLPRDAYSIPLSCYKCPSLTQGYHAGQDKVFTSTPALCQISRASKVHCPWTKENDVNKR